MAELSDREARLALSCVVEPGDLKLRSLLAQFTPAEVWVSLGAGLRESVWGRRVADLDLRVVDRLARQHDLRFIVPGDEEWPQQLAALERCDPVQDAGGSPLGLWVAGEPLAELVSRSLALVGSRASSAYGERVATELAAGLGAEGVTVVSGGAYGIDAAAHRGALAAGGRTVAFLAGGLDSFYPRANEALLRRVREAGALVSEVAPAQHPTRRRFLTRNRLIAAATGGTVIVEAGVRSGARNTVTWAGACGRVVMAVPGPVSSATSYGPHQLIRGGEAVLVTSVTDVLEVAGPMGEVLPERPSQRRLLDVLDPSERAIYEALPTRGGRDTGDLALRAGVGVREALTALGSLAERGMVRPAEGGGWRLGDVQDRPLRSAKEQDEGRDG